MKLIKMTRDEDVAHVRPEWVKDWEAQGWSVGDVNKEKPAVSRKRASKTSTKNED